MRCVLLADLHLGYQAYKRVDAQGVNVRESDFYGALAAATGHILADPPDAVLVAGDLWHNPHPSNRALYAAMHVLGGLGKQGIPVVVISGNHSYPDSLATSPLALLSYLPNVFPVFRGKREAFQFGDLRVQAVPYVPDQSAFLAMLAEARADLSGKHNLLLAHAGAVFLAPFATPRPKEIYFDWPDVEGFDFVALGHYHDQMPLSDRCWYVGSLERLSFGEIGQTKGLLDVTFDKGKVKVRQVPVPTRPMLTFTFSMEDATPETAAALFDQRLTELDAREDFTDKIVRVRVEKLPEACYAILSMKEARLLRQKALHLQIEYDRVGAEYGDAHPEEGETIRRLTEEIVAGLETTRLPDGMDKEKLLAYLLDKVRLVEGEEEAE